MGTTRSARPSPTPPPICPAPRSGIYTRISSLRRARPWLGGAATEPLELSNTRYVYRVRNGDRQLDVELELDGPRAVIRDGEGGELWRYG